MKNAISYLAIPCFFILCTSLAHADPDAHDTDEARKHFGEKQGKHFKQMDTNNDGMISKTEFDAAHDKHFNDMDTNGDNQLSSDEMRAGNKQNLSKIKSKHFNSADTDHDGVLSKEEAKKLPRIFEQFDKIDANKDSKLTPEELGDLMTRKSSHK